MLCYYYPFPSGKGVSLSGGSGDRASPSAPEPMVPPPQLQLLLFENTSTNQLPRKAKLWLDGSEARYKPFEYKAIHKLINFIPSIYGGNESYCANYSSPLDVSDLGRLSKRLQKLLAHPP